MSKKEQEESEKTDGNEKSLMDTCKTLLEDETIDMEKIKNWKKLHLPTHTEGYITEI